MIQRILPLLNKLVPKNIALKGLQKLDPRIGKFISGATMAGYTADAAMDFVREQFGPEYKQDNERPDVKANKELEDQSRLPGKIAGTAAKTALGAGAGMVIGNLFNDQQQEQEPNSEAERQEALKSFNRKVQESNLREDLMKRYAQNYGQPEQNNAQENYYDTKPQQGNIDAELLAALQKILNM